MEKTTRKTKGKIQAERKAATTTAQKHTSKSILFNLWAEKEQKNDGEKKCIHNPNKPQQNTFKCAHAFSVITRALDLILERIHRVQNVNAYRDRTMKWCWGRKKAHKKQHKETRTNVHARNYVECSGERRKKKRQQISHQPDCSAKSVRARA